MNFQISHFSIENFRCFENFETDLWKNTTVVGDNESGKSTIASAILWCLTGKDVEGNSTFEIVPQGGYGKLSPSVELKCILDDKPLTLKRVYKAKFARDKSFSSYETTCFINDLEVKPKKFESYVAENICNEDVFKILSNPYTFVENCPKENKELVWQAQRRLLMSMIESNSDISFAESDEAWAELINPLKTLGSANAYLTYIKQKETSCLKEMSLFEGRLEQQSLNMQEVDESEEDILEKIGLFEKDLEELHAESDNLKHKENAKRVEEVLEKISELTSERNKLYMQYQKEMMNFRDEQRKLQDKISENRDIAQKYIAKQAEYAGVVENLKNAPPPTVCEKCRRPLTLQMINEFKQNTAERIKKGMAYVEAARAKAQEYTESANAYQTEYNALKEPVYPLEEKDIVDEINALKKDLAPVQEETVDNDCRDRIEKVELEIEKLKAKQSIISQNKASEAKIAEIEKEQHECNEKYEKILAALALCKDFISERCKASEADINALFPNVRFKLFEQNKTNDGIKEICAMTFNGHKYEDLSASTKLVANLELLSAFQKYYNAYIPIVIDNMESVTADIISEAQVIKMYVREENCPNCGGKTGRRQMNGLWVCGKCGHEWEKKLDIKEN